MTDIRKNIVNRKLIWRRFTVNICFIIVLFLMIIFVGFAVRTHQLVRGQYLITARAHFKNIVLTRHWNAEYGGVFVKKGIHDQSKPFLENPDITATDGTVYTKKNPVLMTREISVYAEQAGDFSYHITSLNPLNPRNVADIFEKTALKSFETGQKENFSLIRERSRSTYRYMAPLHVEKSCMSCHAKQGYTIGDIRGGISVTFDVSDIEKKMAVNRSGFIGLGIAASLALLGIIFFLVSRLVGKLSTAYSTIEKMSITDDLTRIYNRRYFHARLNEEIHRARRYGNDLSLLMMDIDRFKKINDRYGHQMGDDVLVQIAAVIESNTRKTDIVTRYGGEEFAIILPEIKKETALIIAEKLRLMIQGHELRIADQTRFHVTASFGISSLDMLQGSQADLSRRFIQLADTALYQAKKIGRNKVVLHSD